MVCAISAESILESPAGEVAPMFAGASRGLAELGDLPLGADRLSPTFIGETAEGGDDPFDDFDEDDFDDDFDDDFEEDWEDDLTEDDEFPDTFGGAEPEEKVVEADEDEDSPFADDPDFDEA